MPFQFIDNNSIDPKTRKLIRSHAAKGKNIGKGRPRRKPHPAEEEAQPTASIPVDGTEKPNGTAEPAPMLEFPRSDALSLFTMPFELSPRSKLLFRQVISFVNVGLNPSALKYAINHDRSHSMWVQFIFTDEASLLNTVNNCLLMGGGDSAEALHHLSRTFHLVNEKLSGTEATADTTFAAVIAMTHYYRLQGEHELGLVHLDGLQRMVAMRGGIRHLAETHPDLAVKIFRTDLEFALKLGTPAKFHYSDIINDRISNLLSPTSRTHFQFCNSSIFKQLSPSIQDILLDILRFARLINESVASPNKLDGNLCHNVTILLAYRLVYTNPSVFASLSDGIGNIIHPGLCAFMATFLSGLDRKLPSLPSVAKNLKQLVVQSTPASIAAQEILLWTLVIGRTTVLRQLDDKWVLPRVCEIIKQLGINNSGELQRTLSKLPWINILHDSICEKLYYRVANELRTPPLFSI